MSFHLFNLLEYSLADGAVALHGGVHDLASVLISPDLSADPGLPALLVRLPLNQLVVLLIQTECAVQAS